MIRRYHEQFYWFLAVAILLLVAEMLLPERNSQQGRGTRRYRQPTVTGVAQAGEAPPVLNVPAATIVALIAFFLLPMVVGASPASALRDYNTGNYTNALDEFSRLSETQTNDLRLVFNAGDAAYRATNYDLAGSLFQQVTLSQDINLQQKAYYNLGNTQFRAGEQQLRPSESGIDFDGIQNDWEAAVKSYERACQLDTNDVDAAHNLTFARDGVAEIIQLREAARRAKEAADDATRRRNYDYALAIMEDLLKKNPTAKQFQDYVKKLKDIDDIATPHQP